MKLKTLIERAQALLAEHGNLEVLSDEGYRTGISVEEVTGNCQALDWGFEEGDKYVVIDNNR